MIEIRLHGRGGQGAVTAAEVLAIAVFRDGKQSQAFPRFGPERSGAPVEAYCRIDDKFINLRTQVYNPTHLIVLDQSLTKVVDVTQGLAKNGIIIINSEESIDIPGYKVYNIDATKIAMEALGKPIVNTAILGAFAKATKLVTLDSIIEAIKERFDEKLAGKNIVAIKKAYEELRV
ncbi:MAG: pyruvate ferredoxin oxidoreductase subunit gamma [Candidatus Aenigmarchaeota archaeon]|nr:pyruvate ferredoxin oxidoreductase subunit gamma [Candidatus Aenigmarchaeota archaeon]